MLTEGTFSNMMQLKVLAMEENSVFLLFINPHHVREKQLRSENHNLVTPPWLDPILWLLALWHWLSLYLQIMLYKCSHTCFNILLPTLHHGILKGKNIFFIFVTSLHSQFSAYSRCSTHAVYWMYSCSVLGLLGFHMYTQEVNIKW